MKSLLYLSLLKVKGTVRNQFRTPASALITIFLIFLYGGLVIMAFAASSDNPAAGGTVDTNTAILIGIGMTAIFAFTVMLNKRKVYQKTDKRLYPVPVSQTRGVVRTFRLLYDRHVFHDRIFYHSLFSGMFCRPDTDAGLFPSSYRLHLYVGAGK